MSGYVKIFSEIVESSIWEEDSDTCKVWITLLALCDCDGYVRGSPGWLAGKARVDTAVCELALEKFKQPDHRSRTPDNNGRRIEQLEDGWLVLNYLAFRERLSSDPKAVATRERVRKHRERYTALRNEEPVTTVTAASASASASASEKPKFKEPTMDEVKLLFAKSGGTDRQAEDFWYFYDKKGWMVGKNKMQRVGSAVAHWISSNRVQKHINPNPQNVLTLKTLQ